MRKVVKFVGIAAFVAVLCLGTVAAVSFAQESTSTTDGSFNYYERFRQTLAGILGISVEQYDSAVVQARDQTLSAAVTEGWLTQEQADAMKERMEKAPSGALGGGWGRDTDGRGHGTEGEGSRLLAAAAENLGMTESDLTTALQGGQTIAALAAEKGVDTQAIVDAYLVKVQEDLAQSVTDGRITQEQADTQLEQARTGATERLNAAWTDFLPGGARGGHGGHGGDGTRPARPAGDTDTSTNTETDS